MDGGGQPIQRRGGVDAHPGLYFCGLCFQHALWSDALSGTPIEAKYVVEHVAKRRVEVTEG
jgi:putative flavoprotein involved in K+ transport